MTISTIVIFLFCKNTKIFSKKQIFCDYFFKIPPRKPFCHAQLNNHQLINHLTIQIFLADIADVVTF